jgi:saposin
MRNFIFVLIAILAFSATAQAQCADCELVVGMIETWVDAGSTQAEIVSYLSAFCSYVPGYQTICDQLVNQTLVEVLNYINQDETPTEICTQLGACTSGKKVGPIKTQVGQAECGGCEEVVNVVENWLENSDNQQDVIDTVEVVCSYMPAWESTCDSIVASGVPQFVEYVQTYENATTVCNQIGACGSNLIAKPQQSNCVECTYVVTLIETFADNNASISSVETYLDTVCTWVPDFETQCIQVIAQEVPAIFQYLQADMTPTQICAELGMCSSQKSPKKTVHMN